MHRPDTRYARAGDLMIAYQVTGEENCIDVVFAPGTASNLDLDLDLFDDIAWIERMSRFSRFIRFDKRGTGLSDRGVDAATLEERTDDIRAVMDAVGSERAFIMGNSEGGCMALLFGATYPERTRGLILWGTMPRWVKTDDFPWGFDADEHRRIIGVLAEQGVTNEYLTGAGIGFAADAPEEEVERLLRYTRAAASPTQWAALERMNRDMDVRDILPAIRVPTLVLNNDNDRCAALDAVTQMADRIPGARLVVFPGDTHGETPETFDEVYDTIEEFVTGTRPQPLPDRVLATVVFTDIVGSTERASEIGDLAWRRLLSQHHQIVRRELQRFRGREIDTAGDGFLASFDGPGRAVQCARAIGLGVRSIGVEVRAGVHTGEVEIIGDHIAGIAVHIGARIAALASASEVLVSSTVKDLTAGTGITYEDQGVYELKGVSEMWRLFRVLN
jgi:pimeloyl-ACP methyl ester carboxylesterase